MALMVKDPGARIDFDFDWDEAYPGGQAVVASSWTVAPGQAGGIAITASAHDLTRTTAQMAGGVAGQVYRVTNRVTMSDGQIDERSMTVRVEER